ncbi:hypothetical protein AAK894_01370 [Lachnospiraceae bacterium 46-61]
MHIKKMLVMGAVGILSSACLAFPAFAHGHGHHRQTQVNTNYTAVCTIDGCTETGHHIHNGVNYCGYNHSNGYCDGSCATTYSGGGHHGCH